MSTELKKGVTVRIFVGAPLTAHLLHELKDSSRWKQTQLALSGDADTSLVEVLFHRKRYVGRYLPQKALTVKELQATYHEVSKQLAQLTPKLGIQEFKLEIFPQLFIA